VVVVVVVAVLLVVVVWKGAVASGRAFQGVGVVGGGRFFVCGGQHNFSSSSSFVLT
jgi:hypothetical protein